MKEIYILTRCVSPTYQAVTIGQDGIIRYRVTCTAGEELAARALIRKFYSSDASPEIVEVKKDSEIPEEVRKFCDRVECAYTIYRARF